MYGNKLVASGGQILDVAIVLISIQIAVTRPESARELISMDSFVSTVTICPVCGSIG